MFKIYLNLKRSLKSIVEKLLVCIYVSVYPATVNSSGLFNCPPPHPPIKILAVSLGSQASVGAFRRWWLSENLKYAPQVCELEQLIPGGNIVWKVVGPDWQDGSFETGL